MTTAMTPPAAFVWTRRHVLALIVLCLAALLDTVDVTVVNVAMPAIRESLHFSESGLSWMVNAYMVPFGGFLLLGGRAGDLLGRRRVLVAGTAAFALASLGSALAPSAGVMVGTRAAEGLAAAFVVPMTLALLSAVFPAGPGRNRAFAVWGGVSAAAGTLGLVLGGVLVTAVGWRWIFLVNIPVGALVVAAALRLLPADGPRPATGRGGFDVGGALSVTTGTSLLAYAVVQTGQPSVGVRPHDRAAGRGGGADRLLRGARAVRRPVAADAAGVVAEPVRRRRQHRVGAGGQRAVRGLLLHDPLHAAGAALLGAADRARVRSVRALDPGRRLVRAGPGVAGRDPL